MRRPSTSSLLAASAGLPADSQQRVSPRLCPSQRRGHCSCWLLSWSPSSDNRMRELEWEQPNEAASIYRTMRDNNKRLFRSTKICGGRYLEHSVQCCCLKLIFSRSISCINKPQHNGIYCVAPICKAWLSTCLSDIAWQKEGIFQVAIVTYLEGAVSCKIYVFQRITYNLKPPYYFSIIPEVWLVRVFEGPWRM